jgi:hypothetical protein
MKKDIPFYPVEGVSIAIAPNLADPTDLWEVHVLNENEFTIENVTISSRGYGFNKEGATQETSVLRHHIDELHAAHSALVEQISPEVFHLTNEYWVSYFIGPQVYDKKFIFLPESLIAENATHIPLLNREAVWHK